MRALAFALAILALPVAAQERVTPGTGAVLRGLDKTTGRVTDVEIGAGEAVTFGRLGIGLKECRYPEGNPAGDAYAFLRIVEEDRDDPVFQGWMVASSPALNAMDHPRYDVWVLRCKTS